MIMTVMTPLYDAATTAERIKMTHRIKRENLFRLRRLRRVPMAHAPIDEQALIHRSAFAVMVGVWYRFLQTENGQRPPTKTEYDAAADAINKEIIFGIVSTWYMHYLRDTPYAALAPYTIKEVHRHLSLAQRFQNRLDNGQQWLTAEERVCYNHVHPHRYRHGKQQRNLLAPAVTEAVWNIHDYMARQLGEHYAATGRPITPDEYNIMALETAKKMRSDAYQSSSDNVERTLYDILGRAPFTYLFGDDGMLRGVERRAIVQDELTIARQDPEVQAIYERQKKQPIATGCPAIHAKIEETAVVDGHRNPNNFISYLLGHALKTMKRAVFEPNLDELEMWWTLSHGDVTAIPVGKKDYRPAMKARAANSDRLES